MKMFAAACAVLLMTGTAQAQFVFNEGADAGQTLATARSTAVGAPGRAITGINGRIGSLPDADLYRIYIADPASFSAMVSNTGNSIAGTPSDLDTALFLFDGTGQAIATNDDDGQSLLSALPAGNARYANLAAGNYYLGISNSGNEPVNSVNQLLFATYTGGDPTSIRGPAGGLNPTTLSNFNSNQGETNASLATGGYIITLTGVTTGVVAAVPEPAAWGLMLVGFAATGATLRRRRRTLASA